MNEKDKPTKEEVEQVGKMMVEYYKSVPTGRALGELRFSLKKSLEAVNHALDYKDRDEMLKDKDRIEKSLKKIDKVVEERKKLREAQEKSERESKKRKIRKSKQ